MCVSLLCSVPCGVIGLSNCFGPMGPRNASAPDHQSQAFEGHPLCGLHAPASIGGATSAHQVGAAASRGGVLDQGEPAHQAWKGGATGWNKARAGGTSKIKVECKTGVH